MVSSKLLSLQAGLGVYITLLMNACRASAWQQCRRLPETADVSCIGQIMLYHWRISILTWDWGDRLQARLTLWVGVGLTVFLCFTVAIKTEKAMLRRGCLMLDGQRCTFFDNTYDKVNLL